MERSKRDSNHVPFTKMGWDSLGSSFKHECLGPGVSSMAVAERKGLDFWVFFPPSFNPHVLFSLLPVYCFTKY